MPLPSPAEILAAHGALVWTICRRLADDPEDAAQDVWERVLRGLPGFDPAGPAKLSTWIAVVAHRTLVDRARRRRTRGEEVEPDELVSPPSEPGLDLERALARLPAPWRRVVVMHHVHGLGLDEIAASEAVPVGTVKSRLHRARGALAVMLDP